MKHEMFVRLRIIISVFVCLFFTAGIPDFAQAKEAKLLNEVNGFAVIQELKDLYKNNPEFRVLMDKALNQAVTPPGGCTKGKDLGLTMQQAFKLKNNEEFCWVGRPFSDLVIVFESWLTSLVFPAEPYTGFAYYKMLYSLVYQNNWGMQFLENEPGLGWTRKFTKARGQFMDTDGSMPVSVTRAWKKNIGELEWSRYKEPSGGYKNFNAFFTRSLKEPQPVAGKGDDSILVSPADSSINIVNSNLKATTQIHTKYGENLNIRELLAGSKYADSFNGGTAISCVLMPNVYHRYHSPVTGEVVESKDVNGAYFGMGGNFYSYINNGNVGGYLSNYGIFGIYHRGYYIIKTKKYGNVAMIPIGLDDVSSVNFVEKYADIPSARSAQKVTKGDELGHFAYGGSTVVLLFEPGVIQNLSVNQGMQIGKLAPK